MELIGNSGYGSMIMDKEKHTEIKYFDNEHGKTHITLDLPTQLGHFMLQYAKNTSCHFIMILWLNM